jgi:hypothetical protein
VAIGDFNIFSASIGPAKADPKLIIDSDAVLSCAVPNKRLKPIARRRTEIGQRHSGIEHVQLPYRDFGDVTPTLAATYQVKRFGLCVAERSDWHNANLVCVA